MEIGERLKHYSFFDGEISKNMSEILETIKNTDKRIIYTHGLSYRNPTIHNVPITKERAKELFEKYSLIDFDEYENCIDINTYSDNDLF